LQTLQGLSPLSYGALTGENHTVGLVDSASIHEHYFQNISS